MKIWLRIGISLFLVLLASVLFWLFRSLEIPAAGQFALVAGSGTSLIASVAILLATLYQFAKLRKDKAVPEEREKRKEKIITPEYVEKRLEEQTRGTNLEYLEGALIFEAGEFIAWAKMRSGEGRLAEYGGYSVYKAILDGLKMRIRNIFESYPQLREESYLLSILERVHPPYEDKALEIIGETAEMYKKKGWDFIEKKGLKALASIIKKYVSE